MTLFAMVLLITLAMLALWGLKPAALTANANVDRYLDQEILHVPVQALAKIWKGAMVGLNPGGYAKPFEAGDRFAGVAYEEVTGGATDGAASCRIFTMGDFELPLTGVAVGDRGKPAYAIDDQFLSLTGHPDGYVGRILGRPRANVAMVRLRSLGEVAPNGQGSIVLELTGQENFAETGAVAGTTSVGGFDLKSILGLGWTCNDAEDGGIKGEFDATAEVALCSARTRNDCLPVDKAVTMELELLLQGTRAAAIDVNFGLGTALTTNSEANIDHADMVQLACFNVGPGSDNVLFQSDDNVTDVAAVDTTVDNDTAGGTYKKYKVIARPDGRVEAWVDGVRVLSTTAFAIGAAALVSAFINMEKTANAAVGTVLFRKLRVAAGMAA